MGTMLEHPCWSILSSSPRVPTHDTANAAGQQLLRCCPPCCALTVQVGVRRGGLLMGVGRRQVLDSHACTHTPSPERSCSCCLPACLPAHWPAPGKRPAHQRLVAATSCQPMTRRVRSVPLLLCLHSLAARSCLGIYGLASCFCCKLLTSCFGCRLPTLASASEKGSCPLQAQQAACCHDHHGPLTNDDGDRRKRDNLQCSVPGSGQRKSEGAAEGGCTGVGQQAPPLTFHLLASLASSA